MITVREGVRSGVIPFTERACNHLWSIGCLRGVIEWNPLKGVMEWNNRAWQEYYRKATMEYEENNCLYNKRGVGVNNTSDIHSSHFLGLEGLMEGVL